VPARAPDVHTRPEEIEAIEPYVEVENAGFGLASVCVHNERGTVERPHWAEDLPWERAKAVAHKIANQRKIKVVVVP
jgi:hypothetical protein